MKLNVSLAVIAVVLLSATHVPESRADATVPQGQPVPELGDGLPVKVQQNARSFWNSAVGTYWLPGSSFSVVAGASQKGSQAAVAFGALGALAYIGATTKASADKVEADSASKVPDLEKLTDHALRQAFTVPPARAVLSPDARETYPIILVTPAGTFSLTSETDATLTIGMNAVLLDASRQVLWRGYYSYASGISQPLTSSGWFSEGDMGLNKATERAVEKLSKLMRHDLDHQTYPDKKDVQVDRKNKGCGTLVLAKRVTLLESDEDLRIAAVELDERNGTFIRVSGAKQFDSCLLESSNKTQ